MHRSPMVCRPRSRGIATFLVFGGALVLLVLAFLYIQHMRQWTRLTHRFLHDEIAHQLASSGVNVALSAIQSSDLTSGPNLRALREGLSADVNGRGFSLSHRTCNALASVVAAYDPDDEPAVNVDVKFVGWKSLYPPGFRTQAGTPSDPVEKGGLIKIESTGRYAGIERSLTSYKAAKVVRSTVPLLGRFTLFVKNPPPTSDGLNLLAYEKDLIFPSPTGNVPAGATHDALVLRNSQDPFDPARPGPFDRSGWIFLGSQLSPTSRWVLNLTYGTGLDEPFQEGFMLPPQAMYVTADPAAVAAMTPQGKQLLDNTFDRLVIKTGMYSGVQTDSRVFSRYTFDQDPMRCSSLHLFGTADEPSPTIVLGSVYRRYLLFSYITDKPHRNAFYLPYGPIKSLNRLEDLADAFGFDPPPDGTPYFDRYTVIDTLFSDSPTVYEPFMSNVPVEPYARNIDHIVKNRSDVVEPDSYDPPYTLLNVNQVSSHLDALGGDPARQKTFLYDADQNSRAKITDSRKEVVFEGDLNGFGVADLMIPERVTYVFRKSDFDRWTAGGKLRVKGIMYLHPDEPDLTIDRPLEIEEGGVIVAKGDIVISARITSSAAAKTPLTLVSLTKRIRVKTDKVHAFLVALGAGGIVTRETDAELELMGGIAATSLDVAGFSKGSVTGQKVTKTLAWDPRSDPLAATPPVRELYLDTNTFSCLRAAR